MVTIPEIGAGLLGLAIRFIIAIILGDTLIMDTTLGEDLIITTILLTAGMVTTLIILGVIMILFIRPIITGITATTLITQQATILALKGKTGIIIVRANPIMAEHELTIL